MPYLYDGYSPFMAAVITTPDGNRVPLFTNLNHGPVLKWKTPGNVSNELTSLPFLESIQVDLNLSQVPTITANLTPPLQDARKLLESNLFEFGQSDLSVQFGYSSGTPGGPVGLSVIHSGLIQPPTIQLGADAIITLKAIGTPGYSMTRQEGHRTFLDMKRSDIIDIVLAGPDPNNKRKITPEYKIASGSDASMRLKQLPVSVSQSGLTDWMFLEALVRDAGCWMMLNGDTLQIMERNVVLSTQPKYTLRFYDFVNGKLGPSASGDGKSDGDFPILSLTSPTLAVWMPGATNALVVNRYIDSKTGEPESKFLKEVEADVMRSGAKADNGKAAVGSKPTPSNPGPNEKTGDGAKLYVGDYNFRGVAAELLAKYSTETFDIGIKMFVDTLGIPDINPGDVVAVRGVGIRYDENYGVFGVVHNMGAHGYTTRLELRSNTSAVLQNAIKSQNTVNITVPAASEDQNKITIAAKLDAPRELLPIQKLYELPAKPTPKLDIAKSNWNIPSVGKLP